MIDRDCDGILSPEEIALYMEQKGAYPHDHATPPHPSPPLPRSDRCVRVQTTVWRR